MRATEFIIEGVAEGLEHADKLSGLVDLPVFTSSTNTSGTAKVVNTGDRIMAVLNIRGVNIPYYISTGGGGKASVPTGKWYPIFGRHSSGWLNKGGEDSINKSYGSNALALGSSRLNNMLGDLSSMESQIPFMKKSGDGIINRDLHPMSYAEVSANPDEFKKRVNSLLAKLGSPPFYKVKATETQGVAEGKVINTYLWHGSRQKIPMLEPRQSVDTGGAAGSNQNAIYATSDPKVAIAMGLTTPGSDTGMFPNDPQMVLFSGKIRKGEYVYLHKLPFNGPDGKPQFVQGGNSREFHSIPGVEGIKPIEIKEIPVNKYLNLIRKATPADLKLRKKYMKKQGVDEGFSNDMSTEDMIAYLRQHHDTNLHQDYLNHVNTFSKFVLKDIPVNSIKTDLSGLDREKVKQYKQMDFSKAPPIVMGGGYILDGYHRANVANALGIPTIKAYVGITTK
jgi:hypothetical protein